jgi:hypothetical protein
VKPLAHVSLGAEARKAWRGLLRLPLEAVPLGYLLWEPKPQEPEKKPQKGARKKKVG